MNDNPRPINQSEINNIAWKACDTFRGVVDPSEYKNFILVMLFLKYISDVWRDHYERYKQQYGGDEERTQRRMEREKFVLPEGADFYTLYRNRNADNIGELINQPWTPSRRRTRPSWRGCFGTSTTTARTSWARPRSATPG